MAATTTQSAILVEETVPFPSLRADLKKEEIDCMSGDQAGEGSDAGAA